MRGKIILLLILALAAFSQQKEEAKPVYEHYRGAGKASGRMEIYLTAGSSKRKYNIKFTYVLNEGIVRGNQYSNTVQVYAKNITVSSRFIGFERSGECTLSFNGRDRRSFGPVSRMMPFQPGIVSPPAKRNGSLFIKIFINKGKSEWVPYYIMLYGCFLGRDGRESSMNVDVDVTCPRSKTHEKRTLPFPNLLLGDIFSEWWFRGRKRKQRSTYDTTSCYPIVYDKKLVAHYFEGADRIDLKDHVTVTYQVKYRDETINWSASISWNFHIKFPVWREEL